MLQNEIGGCLGRSFLANKDFWELRAFALAPNVVLLRPTINHVPPQPPKSASILIKVITKAIFKVSDSVHRAPVLKHACLTPTNKW